MEQGVAPVDEGVWVWPMTTPAIGAFMVARAPPTASAMMPSGLAPGHPLAGVDRGAGCRCGGRGPTGCGGRRSSPVAAPFAAGVAVAQGSHAQVGQHLQDALGAGHDDLLVEPVGLAALVDHDRDPRRRHASRSDPSRSGEWMLTGAPNASARSRVAVLHVAPDLRVVVPVVAAVCRSMPRSQAATTLVMNR